MGREEAAAGAAAGLALEPDEGALHGLLGPAGPLEDRDAVAVGRQLLAPAVRARDELAGDRGDLADAREDLIEDRGPDADAGAHGLGLRDVAEVVVGDLVGEDSRELLVV